VCDIVKARGIAEQVARLSANWYECGAFPMMGMQIQRMIGLWLVGLVLADAVCGLAASGAAKENPSRRSNAADQVALFEAIEAGDVAVTVIPQRAERVTLQIANKTDRPLAIEVPEALAAGPVLAQLPIFPGGANQNDPSANAPQAVGFPGPGQNNNMNAGQGLNLPMNPGFFNVPAGRVIKVKLPATCLEFGRREPNSRIAYELKPLAAVTERKEVATILSMIGRNEVRRRIGQLAIWNLANGTEWSEIAKLRSDRIDGLVAPQFSAREIREAQALVKKVTEPAGQGTSLSRR